MLIGVPFFDAVFSLLDCEVAWNSNEGDFVQPVSEVATVTGKVSERRTALLFKNLNFLITL